MVLVETYKLPCEGGGIEMWVARVEGSVVSELGVDELSALGKLLRDHSNLFGVEVLSKPDKMRANII